MTVNELLRILFLVLLGQTILTFFMSVRFKLSAYHRSKPGKYTRTGRRLWLLFDWGIMQKRLFRRPFTGIMHALAAWGAMYILFNSLEMTWDGFTGTSKSFSGLGWLYHFLISNVDVYSYLATIVCFVFLFRRLFMKVKRFEGPEMKASSRRDGIIILIFSLIFMMSLSAYNITYLASIPAEIKGSYPISLQVLKLFSISPEAALHAHYIFWWMYMMVLFVFVNYVPFSKQFHMFTAFPNIYNTNLGPLAKMQSPIAGEPDGNIETYFRAQITRKKMLDILSCTECGLCVAVCPASITGKDLSPRKIIMDCKKLFTHSPAPLPPKTGGAVSLTQSLSNPVTHSPSNLLPPSEIWACTTCAACTRECPVAIDPMAIILDIRRAYVANREKVPPGIGRMFGNIEKHGNAFGEEQLDNIPM